MVYRALGFRPSAVSHCIVGHTMDRFFPVKKAVETVTLQALVAAILFFRCADIFSGKQRQTAYNLAQKSAAFLQKRVLASLQRLLCRAANRGSADHCRILPYELHAIRHIVQPNLYAVMPRNTNLLQHAYLQAWKRNLLPENCASCRAGKCALSGQPKQQQQQQ